MVSTAPLHCQAPPTAILTGICTDLERDTAEKIARSPFSFSRWGQPTRPTCRQGKCFPHLFYPRSDSHNPGLFSQAPMTCKGDGTQVGENNLQIRTSGSVTFPKVENIC